MPPEASTVIVPITFVEAEQDKLVCVIFGFMAVGSVMVSVAVT